MGECIHRTRGCSVCAKGHSYINKATANRNGALGMNGYMDRLPCNGSKQYHSCNDYEAPKVETIESLTAALKTSQEKVKGLEGYKGAFDTINEKYESEGLPPVKIGESLVQNICLELEGSKRAEQAEAKVAGLVGKLTEIAEQTWDNYAEATDVCNIVVKLAKQALAESEEK